MTTVLTEGAHDGAFLIAEGPGDRSREEVTLEAGNNLAAGTVLGKVADNSKYVALDSAATDGSASVAGILFANVDATLADKRVTIIARDAVVDNAKLKWPEDSTVEDTGIAALAVLGIICRN